VIAKVYEPGDAAATAANVVANSGLVRIGVAGSNALVMLLLDTQHYRYLIAQIFFGLWLVPMGYPACKSGMFPKALGVVLIVAGVCYLVDLLALFLVPDFGKQIHGFLAIAPIIAEPWMVGYLLVIGVKTVKSIARLERECGAAAQPVCELGAAV